MKKGIIAMVCALGILSMGMSVVLAGEGSSKYSKKKSVSRAKGTIKGPKKLNVNKKKKSDKAKKLKQAKNKR